VLPLLRVAPPFCKGAGGSCTTVPVPPSILSTTSVDGTGVDQRVSGPRLEDAGVIERQSSV
jgi:hypothetical protein